MIYFLHLLCNKKQKRKKKERTNRCKISFYASSLFFFNFLGIIFGNTTNYVIKYKLTWNQTLKIKPLYPSIKQNPNKCNISISDFDVINKYCVINIIKIIPKDLNHRLCMFVHSFYENCFLNHSMYCWHFPIFEKKNLIKENVDSQFKKSPATNSAKNHNIIMCRVPAGKY